MLLLKLGLWDYRTPHNRALILPLFGSSLLQGSELLAQQRGCSLPLTGAYEGSKTLYIKLKSLTITHLFLWREGPELSSKEMWRKLTDDYCPLAMTTYWHQFTLIPMEKWQNPMFCTQGSNSTNSTKWPNNDCPPLAWIPMVKKNWMSSYSAGLQAFLAEGNQNIEFWWKQSLLSWTAVQLKACSTAKACTEKTNGAFVGAEGAIWGFGST